MSESDFDRIRYSQKEVEIAFSPARQDDAGDEGGVCPRCGEKGAGPYMRRVGKGDNRGCYYKHSTSGRTVWHYVPKNDAPKERREKLVRLLHEQGFRGLRYFARLLDVSGRTIHRDLQVLQSEGRIIHKPYGTYIADPSGKLLKEKPWLAWVD